MFQVSPQSVINHLNKKNKTAPDRFAFYQKLSSIAANAYCNQKAFNNQPQAASAKE